MNHLPPPSPPTFSVNIEPPIQNQNQIIRQVDNNNNNNDEDLNDENILKKLIGNSHVLLSILFGFGGLLFLLLFLDSHYKTLHVKRVEYYNKFGKYPPP